MANTLTGLIPTIYTALDIVRRELIGFIPNVTIDASASSAAVGQTVRAPVVPQGSLENITAGAAPAASGSQTIGYTDVTISNSKAYPILWNGEEQLSVSGQYSAIVANQFAQGFRTLANAVEADLAGLYVNAARATGTAGTTPFGTINVHSDWALANKLLDEMGAPSSDRAMIVGSAARASIEGIQAGLFRANEAGTDALLRNRVMREIHGFTMGYSAGISSHTKGTGASWLLNDASSAAADVILAADGGTGTILAGDVITLAGDTTKHVVGTALAGGNLTINEGLDAGLADDAAITVGASHVPNMYFHRNALLLAARAPAMPAGGDGADDVITVTDPVSGLTFQVAMYRQYRQVKIEIGLAWGVAAPNNKFCGLLLG